jgi:nicotinamidase-related amidase
MKPNMHSEFAVLVIDMLVDFFEGVPELAAQRTRLTTAINQLTSAARSAGQPVIWVRQEFRPDLSDAFLDMRRRRVAVTIVGTNGAMILPELTQASGDHVVVKKRYSAFFGTSLDDLLATLNPRTLIVAGINTHACIRTTVVDAYQRDYDVVLAADAIASYDAEHHAITMKYLDGKLARLASNAEIGERLRARGAGPAHSSG